MTRLKTSLPLVEDPELVAGTGEGKPARNALACEAGGGGGVRDYEAKGTTNPEQLIGWFDAILLHLAPEVIIANTQFSSSTAAVPLTVFQNLTYVSLFHGFQAQIAANLRGNKFFDRGSASFKWQISRLDLLALAKD